MKLAPRSRPSRFRRPHRKAGSPGGNYEFTCLAQTYSLPGRFLQDMTSPSDDHLRWVGTTESNRIIRQLVWELASQQCQLRETELCWKWAPLRMGQPHHKIHKKMGGAFTDDRIWLTIGGEVVQIRVWACPQCHSKHHNHLHWTGKENVA